MNPKEIIAQIPSWSDAQDLLFEPLRGLTNTNYLVTTQGQKFVLRVCGNNSDYLGINRRYELEALQVAGQHGLAPEVIHFILPEGHLVTRFIEGHHWTYDFYCRPDNIRRIVTAVKTDFPISPAWNWDKHLTRVVFSVHLL